MARLCNEAEPVQHRFSAGGLNGPYRPLLLLVRTTTMAYSLHPASDEFLFKRVRSLSKVEIEGLRSFECMLLLQ